MTPTDNLGAARTTIDETDREIIRLLARRFDAVKAVAQAKAGDGDRPILDNDRERGVLAAWLRDAEALGLSAPFTRRVLKEILNHSRRLQEPLVEGSPARARRVVVGYQGVKGSYSALAAAHLLATRSAQGADLKGFSLFQDVVDALQAGAVDYAFLPIENSIGGAIADVNRLIIDNTLHIVDEEVWEVDHVLAGLPGASLDRIRTVRSHPAALVQCEGFLRGQDDVVRQPWFDTAGAAESLLEAGDPTIAAICSEEAARGRGLDVLATRIADQERNETRFLLIARDPEPPDPRIPAKTSLVFRLNHHEGTLARALGFLSAAGANLTRIESRPLPATPWEYLFFVDVEGNQASSHLAKALKDLRGACNHLRVLGSYPHRARGHEQALETAPVVVEAPEPAPAVCGLAPEPQPSPRERTRVQVGPIAVGEGAFVLMAGPCAVESREQIMEGARMVRAAGATILRGGAFKPRTSPYAFQGLGLEGVALLKEAGAETGMPTVTEVLTQEDIPDVAPHVDMLQVGARNMHNFALLKELGRIDKPVLLKRGMSATLKELLLAAEYILAGGNQRVILCERGIRTFETATRATLDVSAVPVLKRMTHLPVIVDPSHAAGERDLVVPLALAAAAAGADGLIVEAHPWPETALCDKAQALTREDMARLAAGLRPILESQGRTW
ncbi:MAG TPA: 3-deoxy-7-phosphoheptulonate synthase [Holophaga sp.]|nr:3-deoxy-7-phosphoheptulonate synthase [Holophaga sp.]